MSNPKPSLRPAPVTPDALRIEQALHQSVPLARLKQRMQESNARFEAIRPSVPAALAAHVRPGPIDDDGWSLLAANAGVAAKLRQLQPLLEDAMRQRGWQVTKIRVKVLSR
ncbi:MAG: DciA family protein [Burkholderiaceae bacterium]